MSRANRKGCRAVVLAAAAAVPIAVGGHPSTAWGSTYAWSNMGSAWETTTNWVGGVVPTSTDTASFDPTAPTLPPVNPVLSGGDVAETLDLDNNALGGNYALGGTGTLTLANTSGGGIAVRGVGTSSISGPVLSAKTAANFTFNVGNDAGLTLGGTTTALTCSAINVSGGTFTCDDSAHDLARLSTTNSLTLASGGTFSLIGNASAAMTLSLGSLYASSTITSIGGVNTISVTPNGALTRILFSSTASTSARPGGAGAYQFAATSGALGDTAGGQVAFTNAPSTGAGGLLSTSSTTSPNPAVGFATVRDKFGVNWATYNGPNTTTPVGVVSVASTYALPAAVPVAAAVATDLQATTYASKNVQFNAPASTTSLSTSTSNATPTLASLRISPAGPGGTLDLAAFNLATNALMLDGPANYAITGTGTLGSGGSTDYIYVNNPATTLSLALTLNVTVSDSTPATVIAGPGVVALTGTASQNTLTTIDRLALAGGVLRADNAQVGFTGSTGNGVISFGGGVLEITGGLNGNGTAADFTRPLTAAPTTNAPAMGDVTWNAGSYGESGSGGFSAYGSAASVNLGGYSAPLTWNVTPNFVADGNALKFGSLLSNAPLTFQNPIALDAGTAGLPYAAREINVTAGPGGDKTLLTGGLSGSSSADLIKTGTGTLVLSAPDAALGRTIVEAGTLAVTKSLAGPVIVAPGGTLTAGTGSGTTTADSVSAATTAAQTWVGGANASGGTVLIKVASAASTATASNDELVMSGLTLAATPAAPFTIALGVANASAGVVTLPLGTTLVLAHDTDRTAANPFNASNGNAATTLAALRLITPGVTAPPGYAPQLQTKSDSAGGFDLIADDAPAAAPEPTSLLLLALTAAPLALGRRRRQ